MTLPLPPDRNPGRESEMIITGSRVDYLRFVAAARLVNGTFKAHDDKIITTFGAHGGATMVRVHYAGPREVPQFIHPDGYSTNVDALVIRGREADAPPSVSMVSLEIYGNGADQRLTKTTLTQGDPEIVIEEVDPSDPNTLMPEDQRVLQAILTARQSLKKT